MVFCLRHYTDMLMMIRFQYFLLFIFALMVITDGMEMVVIRYRQRRCR